VEFFSFDSVSLSAEYALTPQTAAVTQAEIPIVVVE
jgi:hypothetical protein